MEQDRWREQSNIRQSLHAGGIYLTFRGDDELPFIVAKIVSIDGEDLWRKLFRKNYAERPTFVDPTELGEARIVPASIDMFLAWGPPKFPILIAEEPVTDDELAQRNYYPGTKVSQAFQPDTATESGWKV